LQNEKIGNNKSTLKKDEREGEGKNIDRRFMGNYEERIEEAKRTILIERCTNFNLFFKA